MLVLDQYEATADVVVELAKRLADQTQQLAETKIAIALESIAGRNANNLQSPTISARLHFCLLTCC